MSAGDTGPQFYMNLLQENVYPHSFSVADQIGRCALNNPLLTRHDQTRHPTALSNSELVGAIIGQVAFGMLADKLGRKLTFIATISMVISACHGPSV